MRPVQVLTTGKGHQKVLSISNMFVFDIFCCVLLVWWLTWCCGERLRCSSVTGSHNEMSKFGEKCLTRALNMSVFVEHRVLTVLKNLKQKVQFHFPALVKF